MVPVKFMTWHSRSQLMLSQWLLVTCTLLPPRCAVMDVGVFNCTTKIGERWAAVRRRVADLLGPTRLHPTSDRSCIDRANALLDAHQKEEAEFRGDSEESTGGTRTKKGSSGPKAKTFEDLSTLVRQRREREDSMKK